MTGGSVHHGDTPLTHDDPDCPPNRSAFTLTGPSQNLRCWFGKGTQISISTEPFADVPPLLFPSFGLVVGLVCPRHMVDWPQCVCAVVSRCRGPGTQQVPMVVRPSWEQWSLRGCVCQSRSPNPHWLPQMVGEGWEDEGTILWYYLVGLCRCGDGPL